MMVKYLLEMDIVDINRKTLEFHNKPEDFHLMMPGDLDFCIQFVRDHSGDDHSKSLAYCISIILFHPFHDANHRTSLYSAERFLIINGYQFTGTVQGHKELQKWRIEHEEEHELERRFAQITFTENKEYIISEINKIMKEEYGCTILSWLQDNYRLD